MAVAPHHASTPQRTGVVRLAPRSGVKRCLIEHGGHPAVLVATLENLGLELAEVAISVIQANGH